MPQIKATATFPAKHGGTIIKNACGSWTLVYWLDGKHEKTFRDDPGKPGSGRGKAEDWSLKLAVGKREGDTAFADRSRSDVPFLDYCARWIERGQSRGESTKGVYRSTLKRLAPKLQGRSLAWVADHRSRLPACPSIAGTGLSPMAAPLISR